MEKRPNANQLEKTLRDWQNEITENKKSRRNKGEFSEFAQQVKEIEKEYNQILQSTTYKIHPTEILTSRRLEFRNLPETQNSKEVSSYLKETEEFDSLRIVTEEISKELVQQ